MKTLLVSQGKGGDRVQFRRCGLGRVQRVSTLDTDPPDYIYIYRYRRESVREYCPNIGIWLLFSATCGVGHKMRGGI